MKGAASHAMSSHFIICLSSSLSGLPCVDSTVNIYMHPESRQRQDDKIKCQHCLQLAVNVLFIVCQLYSVCFVMYSDIGRFVDLHDSMCVTAHNKACGS